VYLIILFFLQPLKRIIIILHLLFNFYELIIYLNFFFLRRSAPQLELHFMYERCNAKNIYTYDSIVCVAHVVGT